MDLTVDFNLSSDEDDSSSTSTAVTPAVGESLVVKSRFDQLFDMVNESPSKPNRDFVQHINTYSLRSRRFNTKYSHFADVVFQLLETRVHNMEPKISHSLVSALFNLQKRGYLDRSKVYSLLLTLFRVHDKRIRSMIFVHLIRDITFHCRRNNGKFSKFDSSFLDLLSRMLKDESIHAAKKSLSILMLLFKKNIWRNQRTVQVLAEACFNPRFPISSGSIHFFLGKIALESEDAQQAEIIFHQRKSKLKDTVSHLESKVARKTRKTAKIIKKSRRKLKTLQKNRDLEANDEENSPNLDTFEEYSASMEISSENPTDLSTCAIALLQSPERFSARLYGLLAKGSFKFDMRLSLLHLISRILYNHTLVLPEYYLYFQRYLRPGQPEVVQLGAYLCFSLHDLVDEDCIEPCVKTIVTNFVSDRAALDTIAFGINLVTKICSRQPSVMTKTLLSDLIQYKKAKSANTKMAARSLINLFRRVNPELLPVKERGRPKKIVQKPVADNDSNQMSNSAEEEGPLDSEDDMHDIQGMESESGSDSGDSDSEIEFDEYRAAGEFEPTDLLGKTSFFTEKSEKIAIAGAYKIEKKQDRKDSRVGAFTHKEKSKKKNPMMMLHKHKRKRRIGKAPAKKRKKNQRGQSQGGRKY